MTNVHDDNRILGMLGTADGEGVVRLEDLLDAHINDVWPALTNPARLALWYGEVEGNLNPGGEYRAHLLASGVDRHSRDDRGVRALRRGARHNASPLRGRGVST